jgi:hypothetical protein
MSEKPNLKPCPCCGGGFKRAEDTTPEAYYHLCDFICVTLSPKRPRRIKKWNTRAPTEFEIKARDFLERVKTTIQIQPMMSHNLDTLIGRLKLMEFEIKKFLEENGE